MKQNILNSLFCILCTFLYIGCAGEKYYVDIEDIPNWDKGDTTRYFTLTYTAHVGSNIYNASGKGIYTPDTVPLPAQRTAHMYIYKAGQTPQTNTPFAFSILQSNEEGTLTPQSAQYDLKLPAGTYNAYAMSEFNTTDNNQLNFINGNGAGGLMNGFANGLDFLWWKQEDIVISDISAPIIRVVFEQVSTHIQLNIYADEGQEIITCYSGDISTPQPASSTLQLATGQVTLATDISSSQRTSFVVVNKSFYVNLVPFKTSAEMLVKINVQVANGYPGWKDVYLPIPEGGEYKQGNAYIYNLYYSNPTRVFKAKLQEIRAIR